MMRKNERRYRMVRYDIISYDTILVFPCGSRPTAIPRSCVLGGHIIIARCTLYPPRPGWHLRLRLQVILRSIIIIALPRSPSVAETDTSVLPSSTTRRHQKPQHSTWDLRPMIINIRFRPPLPFLAIDGCGIVNTQPLQLQRRTGAPAVPAGPIEQGKCELESVCQRAR